MDNRLIIGSTNILDSYLDKFDLQPGSEPASYKSKVDNSLWVKVEVDSMYFGHKTPILYKTPRPTVPTLINLTLKSPFDDEAYSAALLLKDGELNEQIDYRADLIAELQEIKIRKLTIDQKTRLQNIILFSELAHGENRRDIIGKKHEEIESDNEYFMKVAHEATNILERIKPNLFEKLSLLLKWKKS